MKTGIKLCDPNSPEWTTLRRHGLGGSDAAAAMGLSQYKTPVDVWLEKTGRVPPQDETAPMRRGKRLESLVVEEFVEATGIKVATAPCGLYRHPEHEWMLGTPDALLDSSELLETKTLTWRLAAKLGADDSEEVPVEWLCQTQHYLAITGLSVCHICVMLDRDTYRRFRVERNDRLIGLMIQHEAVLWDYIERDIQPPIDFSHVAALGTVQLLHPDIKTGDVVQLDEETSVLWEAYTNAGKQIRELNTQRDGWKAAVLAAIGDNYAGLLSNGEKMIRRKVITRKGYTVDPCEYVDARMVNYSGEPLVSLLQHDPVEDDECESNTATSKASQAIESAMMVQSGP